MAAISRIRSQWQPADDEAAIARISHDVFSRHTPLLGMPSTIGKGVIATNGATAHHLGPMLFWLFAVPDRLTGSAPAALVATMALTNMVCIAAVAWQIRRHAGRLAALAAMLGVSIMIWSLGRDITVQIWNPYAALFPFLLFLVLAWTAACGDRIALPAAAGVGSFVMQCHVLFVPLVVTVALGSVISLFVHDRAARPAPAVSDRWRRDRRMSWIATGVILTLCWWTTAYDQVFHRDGNLTRLWHSFNGSNEPPLGARGAFRYMMRAVEIPPLFMRHVATFEANAALVGPLRLWTVVSASVVLVGIAYFAWLGRRVAADGTRLGVLALLALGVSMLVLTRLPVAFGGVYSYRTRFLWVIGLYAWLALVVVAAPAIAGVAARLAAPDRRGRLRIVALATVTVVTVSGGVVASTQRSPASSASVDTSSTIASLTAQVRDHVADRGPYLLRSSGEAAMATVGFGVMWDLVRHGYDIRVSRDDAYLGATHGAPLSPPIRNIVVVSSGPGYRPGADAVRVAFVDTAPGIRRQLHAARTALIARLERARPRLTAAARTVLRAGSRNEVVDGLQSLTSRSPAWDTLLDTHLLRLLVIGGFVRMPGRDISILDKYDDLVSVSKDSLLAVYLTPPSTGFTR